MSSEYSNSSTERENEINTQKRRRIIVRNITPKIMEEEKEKEKEKEKENEKSMFYYFSCRCCVPTPQTKS